MPAKGKGRVSDRQRARIAAGRIAGETAADIANDTGLSKSTVKKQAVDHRTQLLVQRFKAADEAVLARCWKDALGSIEKHLKSKDSALVRDARKDLLRYLTAGDPPQIKLEAPRDSANTVPLATLLTMLHRIENGE